MKLWLSTVLFNLLIPTIMVVFGLIFLKKSPKNINYIFGYRTARSMKNQSTWEFAHKYLGKIWTRAGFVLLLISVVPMLFVIGDKRDVIGNVSTTISFVQLVVLLLSIIPVEKALKKNFDKEGKLKTELPPGSE